MYVRALPHLERRTNSIFARGSQGDRYELENLGCRLSKFMRRNRTTVKKPYKGEHYARSKCRMVCAYDGPAAAPRSHDNTQISDRKQGESFPISARPIGAHQSDPTQYRRITLVIRVLLRAVENQLARCQARKCPNLADIAHFLIRDRKILVELIDSAATMIARTPKQPPQTKPVIRPKPANHDAEPPHLQETSQPATPTPCPTKSVPSTPPANPGTSPLPTLRGKESPARLVGTPQPETCRHRFTLMPPYPAPIRRHA